MILPPLLEGGADGGFLGDQTGIGFDGWFKGLSFVEGRRKVEILGIALHQQVHRVQAVGPEQSSFVGHLGLGNAAHQMGAHVVRLGRWGIVGVATDVEVVVVGFERGVVDDGREAVDGAKFVEGGDDFLDVLGSR